MRWIVLLLVLAFCHLAAPPSGLVSAHVPPPCCMGNGTCCCVDCPMNEHCIQAGLPSQIAIANTATFSHAVRRATGPLTLLPAPRRRFPLPTGTARPRQPLLRLARSPRGPPLS
ncbi:MAG TPA: hypothetical protein VGO93_00175 [Candidatus Xenobia bacterium]